MGPSPYCWTATSNFNEPAISPNQTHSQAAGLFAPCRCQFAWLPLARVCDGFDWRRHQCRWLFCRGALYLAHVGRTRAHGRPFVHARMARGLGVGSDGVEFCRGRLPCRACHFVGQTLALSQLLRLNFVGRSGVHVVVWPVGGELGAVSIVGAHHGGVDVFHHGHAQYGDDHAV